MFSEHESDIMNSMFSVSYCFPHVVKLMITTYTKSAERLVSFGAFAVWCYRRNCGSIDNDLCLPNRFVCILRGAVLVVGDIGDNIVGLFEQLVVTTKDFSHLTFSPNFAFFLCYNYNTKRHKGR